jgi:membrane-associated phospholipid phosphatase
MGVINAIPYTSINHLSNYLQRTAFDPTLSFDTNLAFLPWMFIPYITLYLYYPAAAFLGNKTDDMWRQNIIFHQMMTISCWYVLIIFLVFPVEIDLRGPIQSQLQDGDFWHPFYVFMHSVDTPWNSWPSLHVVQSTQVVLVLRYWYPSETRKTQILQWALLFAWAMLILSTMFTKQHYLWDVITGLAYAYGTWRWWMRPVLDRVATKEYAENFEQKMLQ